MWSRSDHWESDRLRWDWESGDFEICNDEDGSHFHFFDVHFLTSEIESLHPEMPMFDVLRPVFGRGTSVTPASGRKRGPKPAYSKWAALIEAVVILERTGRLKQAYAGPGKLLEELQLQVPEDLQLDDRTIEPVVSYIYDRILSSA